VIRATRFILPASLVFVVGCANPVEKHPSADIPPGHGAPPVSDLMASPYPYVLQLERVVGTYGSGPGQLAYPEGLAVDDLGRLFIADTGNNRVERFDQAGVFLGEFGGFGFGDGQFDKPRDLFVSGGLNLFVLDGENNRVTRYDVNGQSQGTFVDFNGGDVRATLGFVRPAGLAGEATGYLYVSDQSTDRLIVLNPLAGGWSPLGGFGSQPGRFRHPTGLAVTTRGTVYVGDGGNGRVQVLDSFGGFVRAYPLTGPDPSGRVGVAVMSQGEVVACESDSSRITVFSPDGHVLAQLASHGTHPGQLDDPSAVVVDRTDRIYVADTHNNRVQIFRLAEREAHPAH
jgi:DNA-binding beta-propeller fold protein YncE